MTDDLIQRLRDHASDCGEASCTTVLLEDAAVEIERLQENCLHSSREAVKRAGIMAAADWAMYGIDAEGDHPLIQGVKALVAERDALRRLAIQADTDSLAVIRNAKEWQAYAEQIERDTDTAMAEEIQRLRREKPRIERERDALRARIEAAPVGAWSMGMPAYVSLPPDRAQITAHWADPQRVRLVVEE